MSEQVPSPIRGFIAHEKRAGRLWWQPNRVVIVEAGGVAFRGLARHLPGNVIRYIPEWGEYDVRESLGKLACYLAEHEQPEAVIVHADPETARLFIDTLDGLLPLVVLGMEPAERTETTEITDYCPVSIGSSSLAPRIDQLIERANKAYRNQGDSNETI